jgi:hypothetical protein
VAQTTATQRSAAPVMNTAKVVRVHSLGGPEVVKIDELLPVTPKAGEVRIKVQAIGLALEGR